MCKQYLRSSGSLVAIALCLSLMSTPVGAFAPLWPSDGTNGAGKVIIWHAGSSSSSQSLQIAIVQAFCDPAQAVDILEDARVVGKPDFWSVACIVKAGITGLTAGDKILWNKRDEGGSGTGVGPLATNKFIGFMKPSTGAGAHINCPAITGSRSFPAISVTANVWNCTGFAVPATFDEPNPAGDAVSRIPDIGTSDIEPDKFTSAFGFNVPASDFDLDGTRAPTDADDILIPHNTDGSLPGTVALTKENVAQLLFNTPANLLMYQDLQRAQFPDVVPAPGPTDFQGLLQKQRFNECNPAGALYSTDPSGVAHAGGIADSRNNANQEKCMPSLSASVVRSIFTKGGAIRSSLDFQAETTYGSGVYVEQLATTNGATDNTIQICRRVNGSGTQAQFNAILLGYPCDSRISTLVPEGEGPLTTFVTEGESSGDVEKCLNDFNNGTRSSGQNPDLKKRWAIGIQSLEKNAPSATTFLYTNPYRFIKIDGYAPTLVNVHAGQYTDYATQSLQYKTSAPAATEYVFNALKPFIQDPLKLSTLNKTHAFGISGWLATPSATVTPDSELSFTRPVAWFRRVSAAYIANTCALPSAFKKAGSPGTNITLSPSNCSAGANLDGDENCYTP